MSARRSSPALPLIAQHKLVYAPVQHLLDAGTLHALKIKTEAST